MKRYDMYRLYIVGDWDRHVRIVADPEPQRDTVVDSAEYIMVQVGDGEAVQVLLNDFLAIADAIRNQIAAVKSEET